MKDAALLQKLARLKQLVDGLCSEVAEADIKSTVEELREVGRLAKELESEILVRVLSHD